jgi:hypothetical protein
LRHAHCSLVQVITPRFEEAPEQLGADWRLIWESVPGTTYTPERSDDLINWEDVETVVAIADLTFLIDDEVAANSSVLFWRIAAHLDGGDPLVVGDASVHYQIKGANSSVTYRVLAGGTENVTSVVFVNDGIEIGEGLPNLGDHWTLTPDWDPASPQVHRIEAEASTADGRLERSEMLGILLADPVSGQLFLTVCYFGDWSPSEGGPVFRIPEADPLKIYYRKAGGLAAHGTAEAEFPNGVQVRGTISWVYPNFEFRFEGKGIIIPALDTSSSAPTAPAIATSGPASVLTTVRRRTVQPGADQTFPFPGECPRSMDP